jgi:hypothetical protein
LQWLRSVTRAQHYNKNLDSVKTDYQQQVVEKIALQFLRISFYVWQMENNNNTQNGPAYSISLTEKQMNWLTETARALDSMAELKKRGLITQVNEKMVLDSITAINRMLIKNSNKL